MIDQLSEDYDEMDVPKQSIIYDSIFHPFFAWCGVIFAALITSAICWIAATVMQVKTDVAVLVARPEGISRAEYLRDQSRVDNEMQELRARMGRRISLLE
jgi:hypothetical protein